MAKKENTIPTIIDTPEALTAKIAAMKEAQKIFATFTQEQVDKIFKAAATAADKARIPLAKDAVEEKSALDHRCPDNLELALAKLPVLG